MALIYIVEDDEGIQEVYEGAFEDVYETKIFSNGAEFFKVFDQFGNCFFHQFVSSLIIWL